MKYLGISFNIDGHSIFLYLDGFDCSEFASLPSEPQKINGTNFNMYGLSDSQYSERNIDPKILIEVVDNSIRLKETVFYKCVVRSDQKNLDNVSVHFPNQKNKFLTLNKDGNTYRFRYVNYLGKTEISFKDKTISLPIEIIPNKIDYDQEYKALVSEIADSCAALLLEHTGLTSMDFEIGHKPYQSALEQFIFLRKFCSKKMELGSLPNLFDSIKRRPDCRLLECDELRPVGCGVASMKFFTNPFSHSKTWVNVDERKLPMEVCVTTKKESLDTPANRFVKFALQSFRDICNCIIENSLYKKESFSEYCEEAKVLRVCLDEMLNDPFFSEIGQLRLMPLNNQVLEKREGYRQIFWAFSMTNLALCFHFDSLSNDVYEGATKNVAKLYEYWLFLKLREILIEIGLTSQYGKKEMDLTPAISTENGLTISLVEGKMSCLPFVDENRRLKVNFYYNRMFCPSEFEKTPYTGSYSRPFRPDYTIAIYPQSYDSEQDAVDAAAVSYVHFDAKYRVESLTQIVGDDDSSKYEEELREEKNQSVENTYKRGDLLKMHTYNNAIRQTIGSYVLYPGSSLDGKKGNKQCRLYDEIIPGVGAFAVCPGDKSKKGCEEVGLFLRAVLDFNSRRGSRFARKRFFDEMVLSDPSVGLQNEKTLSLRKKKNVRGRSYCMIGFVRPSYMMVVEKQIKEKKTFYFYYYAIKNGIVYPRHKDVLNAKYFRAYDDEGSIAKDCIPLKGWIAQVGETELLAKKDLQKRIGKVDGMDLSAEFYYVVEMKNVKKTKVESVDVKTGKDSCYEGNMSISPHSPKVIVIDG